MRELTGDKKTITNIGAGAPAGNVGLELTDWAEHTARPRRWLLTIVVAVAPSTCLLWGATPGGVADDSTDDIWGLHNDRYGRIVGGNPITTGTLAIGTHHFIVDNIGVYTRIYLQSSAGTVTATLAPVHEANRH